MKSNNENIEIIESKAQPYLFGFEKYFQHFKALYEKNKLPNTLLLNGSKGLGKSTFVYHFINYLLSQGEKNSYSIDNMEINVDNSTFKLIQNNIHNHITAIDF